MQVLTEIFNKYIFEIFDYMPERASTWAATVDWLNNWITTVSVVCTVAITGAMIIFAILYKKKEGRDTTFITHSMTLETVWTVIPTIVVIYVFFWGFTVYREMRTPPANAIEVNVTARKWSWSFEYPTGKRSNELVVPLGKPIRLIMTSTDVLHSFFIPAMRIKEDVRGGVYSYTWFEPIKLGEFHIFCTEYCGTKHSSMITKLRVVTPEEYSDYVLDRSAVELPPEEMGKRLYASQGCNTCHSIDGSQNVGPTFKGLTSMSSRTLEDGSSVTVDENYLRESIVNPKAKVAQGYNANLMPAFEGVIKDEEISHLIAYLKTLS